MTSCQWSVCFRWVSNHTLTPANAGMSNIIAIQMSHSMVVLLSELYGESALCALSPQWSSAVVTDCLWPEAPAHRAVQVEFRMVSLPALGAAQSAHARSIAPAG